MNPVPDILLVIADDMGVHQLGCYGSNFYETPHLDRLAREGVQLQCAYSAAPVCSPGRAALYTGQHPARLHLTNYIPGTAPANPRLLTPPWRACLPTSVETLGDAFQMRGYATAHFGKWHLASDYHYQPGRPMDPESQGFETVQVTRKPKLGADPEADPHHMQEITDHAIQFMTAPSAKPVLCVVAHNALHRPEMAPAALLEKYRGKPEADDDAHRPVLAAMVEEMDRSIGRLLASLAQTERGRNTLVVFTSDHGAFGRSATRKPLRGAKADLYEGGIRVPGIVHWAGHLSPGKRTQAVSSLDIKPTLLELAGYSRPEGLDGRSLVSVLRTADAVQPHDELCWHFPHYHHLGLEPCGAIRVGDFKLIEWFHRSRAAVPHDQPCELYNLATDPGETTDLALEQPAVCAELAGRLQRWRREVGAQEMILNPNFNPAGDGQNAPPPPGDPSNPFGE